MSTLAFLIVWLALRRVDPAQEEAAVLAGRVPLTGVVLPQVASALLAAGCVVYVLTVTEFGASSFEQMVREADEALYASKAAGRNRVTRWDVCDEPEAH